MENERQDKNRASQGNSEAQARQKRPATANRHTEKAKFQVQIESRNTCVF